VSVVRQDVTHPGPGCLIQVLWFVFVGFWLGQLWILFAWILNATIVGLPLGVWMLNRVPQVMILREPARLSTVVQTADGRVVLRESGLPQYPMVLRAVYFLLIGWWFSLVWLELAWLFCLSFFLLPVGLWMFARVPAIVSLCRT
jgi:uncharacterized membrane protein YccF (DUF307 family)